MRGEQDDELYLRWLQYGVFSPINRLHSSNSDFMGKEPWKRCWAVETVAERFLRLRHKLIPYLYSANYQTHAQGIPLCMPMYYRYDCEDAYQAKEQYIFGSQLLVCPITEPMDRQLNLASADVWLPEGRWTDIFSGRIYRGGRWVRMYRDLDTIPVLAPAGAIVPMYRNADTNDLSWLSPWRSPSGGAMGGMPSMRTTARPWHTGRAFMRSPISGWRKRAIPSALPSPRRRTVMAYSPGSGRCSCGSGMWQKRNVM